jgi:hypothetical protein
MDGKKDNMKKLRSAQVISKIKKNNYTEKIYEEDKINNPVNNPYIK